MFKRKKYLYYAKYNDDNYFSVFSPDCGSTFEFSISEYYEGVYVTSNLSLLQTFISLATDRDNDFDPALIFIHRVELE